MGLFVARTWCFVCILMMFLFSFPEERGSMSMKLRASSGTYNVRASELARDKTIKTVKCVVHFLDDTEASFEIDVSTLGPRQMSQTSTIHRTTGGRGK